MPMEICKKEECTGCFACMNVCPKDAIKPGIDENGKTIPVIEEKKCIECGLCEETCPVNHPVRTIKPWKCYAAWSLDEQERGSCSSGGIATELAKAVIEERGIVYGAAFAENLELQHRAVNQKEELRLLKGSKYVQSYIGFTMRELKENLQKGKVVLFIGTPCQVAGVRAYLGKEYENLLLVDLICHGTPPMQYLKEYIDSIDKKKEVDAVTFRGINEFCMSLYRNGQTLYCKKSNRDYYFYAFLKGLIHRDNCYICKYAQQERCSDITIGDFWGLDRSTLKTSYPGRISVVLVNTEQGEEMWKKYQNHFYFEERNVQEAVDGNAQLRRPSVTHPNRREFLHEYRTKSFPEAVKIEGMRKQICMNGIKNTWIYRTAAKIKRKWKVV